MIQEYPFTSVSRPRASSMNADVNKPCRLGRQSHLASWNTRVGADDQRRLLDATLARDARLAHRPLEPDRRRRLRAVRSAMRSAGLRVSAQSTYVYRLCCSVRTLDEDAPACLRPLCLTIMVSFFQIGSAMQ